MAIITVSRGSYSKGKEIAEGVAERLGYDCISRDMLLEASEHFNIPEIKLVRALHDAPSVLERFTHGREKFLTFIQEKILEHAQKDNLVYHGLAGYFMLKNVHHVLKVRILADIEDRVRLEMEREGLSKEKALKLLRKDDEERRKWTLALEGKDPWDARLYDLIIHIHKITVDDSIGLICNTVELQHFKTTPESQKTVDDLLLACQAKIKLIDEMPASMVSADNGSIIVNITKDITRDISRDARLSDQVNRLLEGTPGVKDVKVRVSPPGL